MKIKRRDLLGLGLSTAALAACSKVANTPSTISTATPIAVNTGASSTTLRLGFQPPYGYRWRIPQAAKLNRLVQK